MNIASLIYDTISFLFNRRFPGNFTNVNFCILLVTAKKTPTTLAFSLLACTLM